MVVILAHYKIICYNCMLQKLKLWNGLKGMLQLTVTITFKLFKLVKV